MEYVIHTAPKRLWYVKQYLVPSMIEQDIPRESIRVWLDDKQLGNLDATMQSFLEMTSHGGTWHLQDDVLICRDFKKQTEQHDHGVICGFCCSAWPDTAPGNVKPEDMWYSFQCIRIPNYLAYECAEWFYSTDYRADWRYRKKFDDSFFKKFLMEQYPEVGVVNLAPNLVDHIDYLIGGTLVNPERKYKITRAAYFNDADLVDDLERKLARKKEGKDDR